MPPCVPVFEMEEFQRRLLDDQEQVSQICREEGACSKLAGEIVNADYFGLAVGVKCRTFSRIAKLNAIVHTVRR